MKSAAFRRAKPRNTHRAVGSLHIDVEQCKSAGTWRITGHRLNFTTKDPVKSLQELRDCCDKILSAWAPDGGV